MEEISLIRLGVVGYGNCTSSLIDKVFRKLDPDLRVIEIVDPDEAGARQRLATCDQPRVVFYEYVPYGTVYWERGYRNHEIT